MQPHRRKRGKGGRPRSNPGEARARTIGMCVNAAELDAIQRNADCVGLPVSHWLRNVALSRSLPRSVSQKSTGTPTAPLPGPPTT